MPRIEINMKDCVKEEKPKCYGIQITHIAYYGNQDCLNLPCDYGKKCPFGIEKGECYKQTMENLERLFRKGEI
jgi:hypothetical protein